MRWLGLAVLVGCGPRSTLATPGPAQVLDAVIIPGCPSRDDGTLSGCQWQRAIWGAMLWEDGVTRTFITSGGAVHGRHIEAEAIAAGMVALGVPAQSIHAETQALHSDQNASYALAIADHLGWETLGVASHGGHARSIRQMLHGWGKQPVVVFSMPMDAVMERMHEGLPDVRTDPVPANEWLPMKKRERVLSERLDIGKRPHSMFVYTWLALSGTFGTPRRPMPPVIEPTLCGRRHRVDTRAWPTDVCRPDAISTK